MSVPLAVEVVRDAARLSALEPAWWDLFTRCPDATPFRSPAWVLPWWRAFAPGPLRAAAAWRGAELAALAPMYLEVGSGRLLPLGIGISDDLDVLSAPDAGAEVGPLVLAALSADDRPTIAFEELSPGAAALGWRAPEGWWDAVHPQSRCPTLAWGEGADGISAVVPAGKLRKLRMARRRADRRGAAVETATVPTASEHVEALVRLHAARWEGRGEPGVLADPAVQAFHRDAAPRLAAAGLLHATLLRVDGRVAGAFHGLRRGRTVYAYLGGFDPAFAFESPGTVLMGHAIDAMLAGGAGAVNLLRGAEPYKYEWGAVDRINSRRSLAGTAP